jgi:hypothetical protein
MKQSINIVKENIESLKEVSLHDANIKNFLYDFSNKKITIDLGLEWPGSFLNESRNASITFEDVVYFSNTSYCPWMSGEDWINAFYYEENINKFVTLAKNNIQPDDDTSGLDLLKMNEFYINRNDYFKIGIQYHSGDITEIITSGVNYTESLDEL